MATRCKVCNHPQRDVIEQAMANNTGSPGLGGLEGIAKKYGLGRTSLRNHLAEHMTQEHVARLRHGIPDNIDVSIDEITRQEGEGVIIGLKRLRLELQQVAESALESKNQEIYLRAIDAQLRVLREQGKLAAMYPGKRSTTNNNLVIADGMELFRIVDRVLEVAPDVATARKMLAREFRAAALSAPSEDAIDH